MQGDRWGHLVAARSRLAHPGTLESCHTCAADSSASGRELMGKEPTCTKSKCSKSLGALLDDLDRLVVVAGAHLAHRSDFERAKWRHVCSGSASYCPSVPIRTYQLVSTCINLYQPPCRLPHIATLALPRLQKAATARLSIITQFVASATVSGRGSGELFFLKS